MKQNKANTVNINLDHSTVSMTRIWTMMTMMTTSAFFVVVLRKSDAAVVDDDRDLHDVETSAG